MDADERSSSDMGANIALNPNDTDVIQAVVGITESYRNSITSVLSWLRLCISSISEDGLGSSFADCQEDFLTHFS
jgi:hypothetical protein